MTIESRLRDLAAKASPGPWHRDGVGIYAGPHPEHAANICGIWDGGQTAESFDANAAYIASLDPSTVLRLLDVVEAARARIVYEGADAEPCWRCGGGGSRCEERLGELETCRCCGGRGSHCAVVQSKNGTVACVDHQSKPDQYVAECQSEPELYAALSRLDEGEK